jgi:HlyD family secretion protein
VSEAQAGLSGAAARLSDVAPLAPSAARVEDVFFQQGEWAPANQPILSLLPDERIKVRFFVPERSLSAYRVGRTVSFGCDGCAKGLTARIAYVSPRPEFTPPVIYSREARDRLVYLIEARPSARLNPGQPVDVEPLK